jgi:hypothetical protein
VTEREDPLPEERQTARAVLLVRPAAFASNAETAGSNYFQHAEPAGTHAAAAALREFDALTTTLAAAGVQVHVLRGQTAVGLPDEVFPNNWLSLHADGTAVLYPMLAANRRRERRRDALDRLRAAGYRIERIVDLTDLEAAGKYLEGTGSVVLDRAARIAYACWSPRTHAEALAELARTLRYETVAFRAFDRAGRPLYHTNVLMSVGATFAALCTAAIADPVERERVVTRLRTTGHDIVDLTFDQLHAFAGNLLALDAGGGRTVIALSTTALEALAPAQIRALEAHGELVAVDVRTIERFGGGSVRCMLAEVHLPASSDGRQLPVSRVPPQIVS